MPPRASSVPGYHILLYFHSLFKVTTVSKPSAGVPTLTQWWDLRGHMILRTMLTVALLLVGSPMPDGSKVMIQTKGDTLVL